VIEREREREHRSKADLEFLNWWESLVRRTRRWRGNENQHTLSVKLAKEA